MENFNVLTINIQNIDYRKTLRKMTMLLLSMANVTHYINNLIEPTLKK